MQAYGRAVWSSGRAAAPSILSIALREQLPKTEKKPREVERGSSQDKHPGTHGRRGWPPTTSGHSPQARPGGNDAIPEAPSQNGGQAAPTAGRDDRAPKTSTGPAGKRPGRQRPRSPPGQLAAAQDAPKPAPTQRAPQPLTQGQAVAHPAPRTARARRTTETPAARRDAARHKTTQTANPGAGNATDEQGQAGEEPTPKRPSPPHPQTRRGPPTQPARQLPGR